MSRAKINTDPSKPVTPAQAIKGLRESLGWSQEKLANALRIERLAVLRWENGRIPKLDNYVRLAKLAQEKSPALALYFWKEVGVDIPTLRTLIPEFDKRLKEHEKRLAKQATGAEVRDTVLIPLIDESVLRGGVLDVKSRLHAEIPIGARYVPFPPETIANPGATACVRAPDNFMYPLFNEGDFVAVDATFPHVVNTTPQFREGLVAAYYGPKKHRELRGLRPGLHLRTLWTSGDPNAILHLETAVGQAIAGVPPHARRETYGPQVIEQSASLEIDLKDADWLIFGNVVAWIGSNRELLSLFESLHNQGEKRK